LAKRKGNGHFAERMELYILEAVSAGMPFISGWTNLTQQ
jgi:hypothetical protein